MRWGLVGTHGLVDRGGLRGFTDASNAELVAVLSSDARRGAAFAEAHGLELSSSDLGEFLAGDFEAVWICSPTYLHHEQATAAIAAGKHVLLEKPLALSAELGWDLVRVADRAGVRLGTGYQGRYVPGHQEMKRLIDDGAIGEVTLARTFYGIKRPGPPPEWRQRLRTAHWGALADVGTHHVDLIRMLLGEIAEARGFKAHQLGYETDDTVTAALRLESQALASLSISTNCWSAVTRVEVHGTAGALVAVDTNPDGQGAVQLLKRGEEPQDVTGDRPHAFTAQLETVTRAFDGEDVAYATGEDGARNLEILEQLIP